MYDKIIEQIAMKIDKKNNIRYGQHNYYIIVRLQNTLLKFNFDHGQFQEF